MFSPHSYLVIHWYFSGGCEAHSTGVGIGLLALYLRWLLHLSTASSAHSNAEKIHRKDFNSSNLMLIFLLFAASVVILLLFSKRFGLRFHRNKFVRAFCPCI